MTKKKPERGPLPSYKEPPVNEVVCGLKFAPLQKFMLPHIGLFWKSVLKDFPSCEHAPPLGFVGSTDSATNIPVPRVWLINQTDDRLIQIQKDIFYYNWRRRPISNKYPRYKSVIKPFKKHLSSFIEFINTNDIGSITPIEYELSYINHIFPEHGWRTPAEFGKIFPDARWRYSKDRFLPDPEQISWRVAFPLPNDSGRLSVKIDSGFRKIDETPLYIMEIKAHGIGASDALNDMWKWFDVAHEYIVRGFADLTSQKIQQRAWKRDDGFTG